jgi:glycosyltransferase involved in cell wall biosynthesis
MIGSCSIIIRAYNEEKHIGRLLEGLRQQTLKDVEIILVDSGSTDRTVSVAESFGARIVRIPSAEFTFGRSLNFGLRSATREFVVIASAHVYPVYPDWLESLLRPFAADDVDPSPRNIQSSKFIINGILRWTTQIKRQRFAIMPTPPFVKVCGNKINTMKR